MAKRTREDWAPIPCSEVAARTSNPIRKIVDQLKPGDSSLPLISLSIGDPTLDGNLLPPAGALEALKQVIDTHKADGYFPSFGVESARQAVVDYHVGRFVRNNPNARITAADVVLGSGASHALEMTIGALCDEGANILLPQPGFSLYTTICENRGILPKFYRCLPDDAWQVDLEHLRSLVSPRTKAILLNNPSNPCGSNFSRAHLEAILNVAEELKLPVISDEVYAGMVFSGEVFTSVADVDCVVPRIVVGGTAKNMVVPGWRMGWAIRVDPLGVLSDVFRGIIALSTLIVGPNSLVQGALPQILRSGGDPAYHAQLVQTLESNAKMCHEVVCAIPGLDCSTPQGAMYMMLRIDFSHYDFPDSVAFSQALLKDTNVVVLPGEVFRAPGFVRVVTAKSETQLRTAFERIREFCARHSGKGKAPAGGE